MPLRPLHACAQPGCRELVRYRPRCDVHTRARERERPSSSARGWNGEWRKLRNEYIREHPWCEASEFPEDCVSRGELRTPAREVDHIVAFRGDDAMRLDPKNLRSCCASCHSRKTVKRDGGFGRPRTSG
jgi:5-methylcytosine-specific restriction enzyme A